jgi:hypothetical protein
VTDAKASMAMRIMSLLFGKWDGAHLALIRLWLMEEPGCMLYCACIQYAPFLMETESVYHRHEDKMLSGV